MHVREGPVILPPPTAPMKVAREFARALYQDGSGASTLKHWRGGWWEWRTARWVEIEQRAMAAAAYRFTEHAQYETSNGRKPWTPKRYKVADLLDALAAIAHLPEDVSMPIWLD